MFISTALHWGRAWHAPQLVVLGCVLSLGVCSGSWADVPADSLVLKRELDLGFDAGEWSEGHSPTGTQSEAPAGRLLLESLAELAKTRHPEVAARRSGLAASLSEVDAARAQFYPTPVLQLSAQQGRSGWVAALQQPLWSGGRIEAGVAASEARSRAAASAIGETGEVLALRVADAWRSWRTAWGRQRAIDAGLALLARYEASVTRRVEIGHTAPIDLELVRARIAQLRSEASAAAAAEQAARFQLGQLVGQPLSADSLDPLGVPPGADALAERDAPSMPDFSAHPTLRRFDAEVEAAREEARQRRALLMPTVSARAELRRNEGSGALNDGRDERLLLAAEFAPGAGFSAVSAATAANQRAQALIDSREAARRDLESRFVIDREEFNSTRARILDARRAVESSGRVLASFERQFTVGRKTWLDVLNAARERTQADIQLSDAEAQIVSAYFRLQVQKSQTE